VAFASFLNDVPIHLYPAAAPTAAPMAAPTAGIAAPVNVAEAACKVAAAPPAACKVPTPLTTVVRNRRVQNLFTSSQG
jgi:hypothetical protein